MPAPLLSGREETEITDYFIESAFPTREEVNEVIQALGDASTGLSVPELMQRVNLSKGRIEKTIPELVSPKLVQAANTFLRRSYLPIKPRAMWPAGGLGNLQVTGKIAEAFRAEEGRILCLWADAGWGELVRNGKQVSGRFSDELVDGTVSMVREWNPQPARAGL